MVRQRDLPPVTDHPAATPPRRPGADLRQRLERLPAGHPSSPLDGNGDRRSPRAAWRDAVPRLRDAWARHQEKWPQPRENPAGSADSRDPTSPDHRDGDQRGSWRGEGGWFLDAAANRQVDTTWGRCADAERRITERIRDVESADPGRALVGLDHRLKGRERLKEKIAKDLAEKPGRTAASVLADASDIVRYAFCYGEDGYSAGVLADIDRLRDAGFERVRLKNYWDDPEYKGINSQ